MEALLKLPQSREHWVIISDAGDALSHALYEFVTDLRRRRPDMTFVIASREMEWAAERANVLPWYRHAFFETYRLRGLDVADARAIVGAWARFGAKGLGRIELEDEGALADRLVAAAKAESDLKEGALLGALLRLRFGSALEPHVHAILDRLRNRAAIGRQLLDAFAYVCCAHSEGVYVLSRAILADALSVDRKLLARDILKILSDEAIAARGGEFVLTRHRAIAETGMQILERSFGYDRDDLLVDLAKSAMRVYRAGEYVPELASWRFLSGLLFEAGRVEAAFRVGRACLDEDPTNGYLRAHLGRLCRESGQAEAGIRVFEESQGAVVTERRAFYFEWAATEGTAKHHAINAWLALVSLSDEADRQPVDYKNARIGLRGLLVSLRALGIAYGDCQFESAATAVAAIGLSLPPDSKSQVFRRELARAGTPRPDVGVALSTVVRAGQLAWQYRERELPLWVPTPELAFAGLSVLVSSATNHLTSR
jgi:hypothetical protein